MIAYVSGILKEIEDDSVIIEAAGLGYRVFTPVTEQLVRVGVGSNITLHTYLNIREDAHILYGFLEKSTLKLFKQLINVNGVGPKYALAILTQMHPDAVSVAIASGDHKALTKVSGIGPKTAQRIVLDLKDKVGVPETVASVDLAPQVNVSGSTGAAAEAIAAMESLGYTHGEAQQAVAKVYAEGKSTEQLLKEALKQLVIF
ncbi:MAG: Holliday junction branch migration protein RuvA [Firmicutes bacterium]|nr:Holliday junction branch migration protein RuvA [Bacillota bacterium]